MGSRRIAIAVLSLTCAEHKARTSTDGRRAVGLQPAKDTFATLLLAHSAAACDLCGLGTPVPTAVHSRSVSGCRAALTSRLKRNPAEQTGMLLILAPKPRDLLLTAFRKRNAHIQMTQAVAVPSANATVSLRRLPMLLLAMDLVVAALAAFPVSIPVAIIDSAIIMKMATGRTLFDCLFTLAGKLAYDPLFFFDIKYAAVFFVHFVGFAAANLADTVIDAFKSSEDDNSPCAKSYKQRTAFVKLVWTSTTNIVASFKRDQLLAKLFKQGEQGELPLVCAFLWIFRDVMTMFASFTCPKPLANFARQRMQWYGNWVVVATQLLPVVLVQFMITPFHLLALGIYNDAPDPLLAVRMAYWSSTSMRVVRVFFGWGLGGLSNDFLRVRVCAALQSTSRLRRRG